MAARAVGTLAADSGDPAKVWLEAPDGVRHDLAWPPGFRVQFVPHAEIIAPTGELVIREGDEIELRGGTVGGVFEICEVNGVNWLTGPP